MLIRALIDAGPLVAFYNKGDKWHATARTFFANFRGKLFTTEPVVTEVMWQLAADWRVQNEFLSDLQKELYETVPLNAADFKYVAELNDKYKDLPADFTDLSIVAICEQLKVLNIVSLDAEFRCISHPKKEIVQTTLSEMGLRIGIVYPGPGRTC